MRRFGFTTDLSDLRNFGTSEIRFWSDSDATLESVIVLFSLGLISGIFEILVWTTWDWEVFVLGMESLPK